MRRWILAGFLALGGGTFAVGPGMDVPPRPPRAAALSLMPSIRMSPPQPQPLPDGFQTGEDWLVVFRPALERPTWMDGEVWLTNGQRWIGPWPSDFEWPFWMSGGDGLWFCHRERSAPWQQTPSPPICVKVPPRLDIRPSEGPMGFDVGGQDATLIRCGSEGTVCVRFADGASSAPLRFPLPEAIVQKIQAWHAKVPQAGPLRPLSVYGCVSPDRRRAVFAVRQLGGIPENNTEERFNRFLSWVFPGGLYWADLESGQILTAPVNAPTWPAQQALARSMAERGALPASFLPFFGALRFGPTVETVKERSMLPPKLEMTGCSPSGKFVLIAQGLWHPGERVFFPQDMRRFHVPLLDPPAAARVTAAWVIRIEDGVGYPLAIWSRALRRGYTISWVYLYPKDPITGGRDSRPPDYPLPPDFY